jgi:hypothetical protein
MIALGAPTALVACVGGIRGARHIQVEMDIEVPLLPGTHVPGTGAGCIAVLVGVIAGGTCAGELATPWRLSELPDLGKGGSTGLRR